MEISQSKAYRILEIDEGSSLDEIRAAYKRQALKWHPDKHKNSPEATERFQEISSAYERLTKPEEIEINLTMEQMFNLFAHVFCGHRGYTNGYFFDDTDSDSSDDFAFRPDPFRDRNREPRPDPFREKGREKDIPSSARPSSTEARKNEQELLREEEKIKKQKEKRKERKKRRKAKKRQEKAVLYGGGDKKKKGKKPPVQESSSSSEEEEEDENANKENIQVNDTGGEVDFKSQPNTSSKVTIPGDSRFKENQASSRSDTPQDNRSTHQTEIHDGYHGFKAGGLGDESFHESGEANKESERPQAQSKMKKTGGNLNVRNSGTTDSESDEETQGLDVNSAFFARAAGGKGKKQTTPPPKKEKKKKGKKEETESIEDMDPRILESRKFAVKGNEMANLGNYQAAVKHFTSAIELNPKDFRFFGNRSFCFDHLQMYDHALRDAEEAVALDKTWPKGYYRKGRALSGLKNYSDAEAAFEQVLKLDKSCAEAVQELRTVRVFRLMEMGFNAQQSEEAINQYGNVHAALENLLSQGGIPDLEEVYVSDEEDYITQTIQESKQDARNPENLRSLWIGNLQPTVSEKELKDLFKPYGEVISMRRMPDKFCAFVNYKDPRMASRAMGELQGREVHGKFLLIKFPDNPIDIASNQVHQQDTDLRFKTMILRKNQWSSQPVKPKTRQDEQQQAYPFQSQDPASKLSGPVNGSECYFWRTTGCWYGDNCRYEHLPHSKGVDKK